LRCTTQMRCSSTGRGWLYLTRFAVSRVHCEKMPQTDNGISPPRI
jgi:hypothetical protein